MHDEDPRAVLIIGLFGSGKTSVAIEIADMLEKRDLPYAVIDLDWLTWASTGSGDHGAEHRMMLTNLAAVLANYRAAGIDYYVLARSIRDQAELDSLEAVLQMPLTVVRLTVSLAEIERRIGSDVTAARQDDLRDAAMWLEASYGEGIDDLTVANDRPIRQVALEILDRLGWLPADSTD